MGSILNADSLLQAEVEFSAMFRDALKVQYATDPAIDMLATTVNTRTRVTVHNWLGPVPKVREWLDERAIGKLEAFTHQVETKRWANGLEVSIDDLEDDALSLYGPKIQELALQFRVHKAQLLADFLLHGFDTTFGTAYDGEPFISETHPNPSGTQSNLMHHSLDDTNALFDAIAMMAKVRGIDGTPAGFRATHLIHGPDLFPVVNQLLNSATINGGDSNPTYKLLTPIQSDMLVGAYANYWFVADLSKPIKPLIWQVRRDIQFRSVGQSGAGDTSYEAFLRGKLYYGCDARYNAGYGLWQAVVGSDGTT